MKRHSFRQALSSYQNGFAAVEMILVTPVLLLMVGGIIEITQLLQANSILINLTREGANLVSRTSIYKPEQIMTLIASTASPLDLQSDGAIYITLVTGQEDDDPYVNGQYRWTQSGISKDSDTWSGCDAWENGKCELDDPLPTLSNFPIQLDDEESVYVVEIFYQYSPLTNFIYHSNFTISDTTYL
ncbi:pilus assembly protein [Vibrio fluvialis]|uniref:TadE/TadG family type IV pilus assembly protein n=1 Tax=Vibrio fluvialis TaxID=676 RepID=UPI001EEB427C|nr:TadE family protein [Vibrio fluvialis]ELL9328963.1 pilus assembly protein [Vibrio fluvialis]MCG6350360.1 pilus assembly protein [Vibrio fluvialis]